MSTAAWNPEVRFLTNLARRLTPDLGVQVGESGMLQWLDDLGENLWSKQREIIESVEHNRYTAVASCHGAGKSHLAARAALSFLHTRRRSIVITTAPTGWQVRGIIWRYIRSMSAEHRNKLLGTSLMQEYRIADDWYAIGFKPDSNETDRFQGIHAPHILTIVDEAAGVPDEVMRVLRATMVTEGARYLMIGNPTSYSGMFRDAFEGKAESWNTITIPASETPNITGEMRVEGMITQMFVDEEIAEHGIESDYVQSRIFARFPEGNADVLIAMPQIEAANARPWSEVAGDNEVPQIGIDPARFGGDEFAMIARQGGRILGPVQAWTRHDLDYSTGRCREYIDQVALETGFAPKKIRVVIDETGLGGGLKDNLSAAGYNTTGINFAEKASDPEKWPNVRHEMFEQLRAWFANDLIAARQEDADESSKGLIDSRSAGQLADIMFTYRGKHTGRIIESKDEAKKRRGGPRSSPDRAEALALAFFRQGGTSAAGTAPMAGRASKGAPIGRRTTALAGKNGRRGAMPDTRRR